MIDYYGIRECKQVLGLRSLHVVIPCGAFIFSICSEGNAVETFQACKISLIEAIKIIFSNNFIFLRIGGFFVVQTSRKTRCCVCDFTEQTRTRESQKSRKCYNRVRYDGNSKVNWNENRIVCRKAEISTCCFTCGSCRATLEPQSLAVVATRNYLKICITVRTVCRATVAWDIKVWFLKISLASIFQQKSIFKVKTYLKFYLFSSAETKTLTFLFIYILKVWLTVTTVIFSYFLQMLFLENFTINFSSDNKLLSKSYTINY